MSKDNPKEITAAPADAKERLKAIETAMSQIEKAFGKGSIMKLGAESKLDVQVVSTGSLSLDLALGVGGIPRGRVTEIYGPESGGKTTLALAIVAQAQKAGGTCAFIDAEHALDPVYARALGVNTDELLVSQPDNGEQALEIMELLVRSGAIDVVVIDSVAALTPRAEIEGDMGDSLPGLQARLMSQALRKLTAILSKTVKIKTVKNKVAAPFKEVELALVYGKGFDQLSDLVGLAADMDIIKKAGSFYSYGDERIGQGKEKTIAYIAERPEMEQEIRDRVMAAIRNGNTGEAPALAPAPAAAPEAAEA